MIKKTLLFLFLLKSYYFGQIYEIKIWGVTIASVNQNIKKNQIKYSVKSEGIIDLIWPVKNFYSTTFDSTNYNIINFEKNIYQKNFKSNSIANYSHDNILIYNKKDSVKLKKNTKTIFSLLSKVQNKPYLDLDTKWFNYEHEREIGKARFLWADSILIWDGIDSIMCDHYRLDIKLNNINKISKKSDYFMENISDENMIREIWVKRKKPKKIILAKIKNKVFPFPIYAQLKKS